jgi:D-beta-D-heptose 7-phosphate kinase/D-beta-D-heptose 1-phosphate adenosyltransferase
MNDEKARELIGRFGDQSLVVVGDIMLDKFVRGKVTRFSPEAPSCAVLDYDHENRMLGGAGNAAANLVALGAKKVHLVGLFGHDNDGFSLQCLLQDQGIDYQIQRTHRPTTVKTRFVSMADEVHLLRFDLEDTSPCSGEERSDMLRSVLHLVQAGASGIMVSDYNKGVVTRDLIRALMSIARDAEVPVFIDPKKDHWEMFRGAELVKPNLEEAFAALGQPNVWEHQINDVGQRLLQYTRADTIIITWGSGGMSLYQEGRNELVRTERVQAVDVSGAGDTAMAALTLARLAGATWLEAIDVANAAAGISIGKPGTSTVSVEELITKYEGNEDA